MADDFTRGSGEKKLRDDAVDILEVIIRKVWFMKHVMQNGSSDSLLLEQVYPRRQLP